VSLKENIRFLSSIIGKENLPVAPIRAIGSRITMPSSPSSKLITGLLTFPTVWQHCRGPSALHWPGGAVVDVAAAVSSVVDSAIDVILDDNVISVLGTAFVVASVDCSVDRVTAKVEDSNAVDSSDDKELEGRQGPAEIPPKTIGNIKAVNRILADKLRLSVLKGTVKLVNRKERKGILLEYIEL
jgi:hypothetical protein